MKVLGLDISKRGTGWAMGDASAPPSSGLLRCTGRPGQAGGEFLDALTLMVETNRPDLIAYEAPLFIASARSATDVARLLIGLALCAEIVGARAGVPVHSVSIASWRKAFLGTGKPKDPKAAAIAMCQSLGWEVAGNADRAEACGVWTWAHINHGDRKGVMRLLGAGGLMVRTW